MLSSARSCIDAFRYTYLTLGLVSDLICCLPSLPLLLGDSEGGTVYASVDRPPAPYDVCDGV